MSDKLTVEYILASDLTLEERKQLCEFSFLYRAGYNDTACFREEPTELKFNEEKFTSAKTKMDLLPHILDNTGYISASIPTSFLFKLSREEYLKEQSMYLDVNRARCLELTKDAIINHAKNNNFKRAELELEWFKYVLGVLRSDLYCDQKVSQRYEPFLPSLEALVEKNRAFDLAISMTSLNSHELREVLNVLYPLRCNPKTAFQIAEKMLMTDISMMPFCTDPHEKYLWILLMLENVEENDANRIRNIAGVNAIHYLHSPQATHDIIPSSSHNQSTTFDFQRAYFFCEVVKVIELMKNQGIQSAKEFDFERCLRGDADYVATLLKQYKCFNTKAMQLHKVLENNLNPCEQTFERAKLVLRNKLETWLKDPQATELPANIEIAELKTQLAEVLKQNVELMKRNKLLTLQLEQSTQPDIKKSELELASGARQKFF